MDRLMRMVPRVALTILLICNVGHPCSLPVNFLPATNYDLVKLSPFILVAEAVSISLPDCRATFSMIKPIKGDIGRREFEIHNCVNFVDKRVIEEDDFVRSRPSANSCGSGGYRIGKMYLMFMAHDEKGWRVVNYPLARVDEEVATLDSPWVAAVSRYAEISKLDDYKAEKAALLDLRTRTKNSGDLKNYPRELISDIDRHFASPTIRKNFEDLLDIYSSSESERTRIQVLWAWANRKDISANEIFWERLNSEDVGPNGVVAFYMAATEQKTAIAPLARIFLSRESGDWWGRIPLLAALGSLADREHTEIMLEVFDATSDDEAEIVGSWIARHGTPESVSRLKKRVGGDCMGKRGLCFSLAATGDGDLLDWVEGLMLKKQALPWEAVYVLAISPTARANRLVEHLFLAGSSRNIIRLVQGYSDSQSPYRVMRLCQISSMDLRDPLLDYWLFRTIEDLRRDGVSDVEPLFKRVVANGIPEPPIEGDEGDLEY